MEASVCIRMCTEEKAARTQQLTFVPHEPSARFDNKPIQLRVNPAWSLPPFMFAVCVKQGRKKNSAHLWDPCSVCLKPRHRVSSKPCPWGMPCGTFNALQYFLFWIYGNSNIHKCAISIAIVLRRMAPAKRHSSAPFLIVCLWKFHLVNHAHREARSKFSFIPCLHKH